MSPKTGKRHSIGSHDFRFDPDSGHVWIESGPSQFGRNRDAFGHWFGTQNANPLWHWTIADRSLGRNPHVPAGTAATLRHVSSPGLHYPLKVGSEWVRASVAAIVINCSSGKFDPEDEHE